ncbi:hypothetical protein ACFVTE_16930 [Arthrobacter sp. NPDC058097]|uniref:hypothetical protein n=1 Tax=Arthrobacter sp. NPDC058097 TaxID=3346340 RepID=UPI0036D833D4
MLILIRNRYAGFLVSFVHTAPWVRQKEDGLLRGISIAALVGGIGFIVLGILMAVNVAFPWDN